MTKHMILAAVTAAALAAPSVTLAQSSPTPASPMTMAPAPMPSAAPATSAPSSGMPSTSAPSTSAPATSAPSTSAPAAAKPNAGGNGDNGNGQGRAMSKAEKLAHVKKLRDGSLSLTNVRYGITHPAEEVGKVRAMKSISFDKLRIYRLSSNLKSLLKVSDANDELPALALLGPPVVVAQTNGNNSPIAMLQYVLANVNVSNALNNVSVLNNSNVNVGVSLADVLNGNKISIGQVAGIFVDGLGVITTITK